MANIQEAIQYSKNNPNTAFATELRKRIESGQFNNELKTAGLNQYIPVSTQQPEIKAPEMNIVDRVKDIPSDIKNTFTGLKENAQKGQTKIADAIVAMQAGDQGKLSTIFQTAGALAAAGAGAVEEVGKGALKLFTTPEEEKTASDVIAKFGQKVIENPNVQGAIKYYNSLSPEEQRNVDAAGGVASLVTTFVGVPAVGAAGKVAGKAATSAIETGANITKSAADAASTVTKSVGEVASNIVNSQAIGGAMQVGKDILGRFPQAIKNGAESAAESAARGERIKAAAPAVADAIKSNLDERIINTITAADKPTVEAYRDVVKIAEESANKLGNKVQATKVGGDLAAKQFELINTEKSKVGSMIGDAVKKLDETVKVDIKPVVSEANTILEQNGIKPIITEKGVSLDFSNSAFTTAERSKITELYTLVHESGSQVSPLAIYNKNKLFSKLKREANFDGIGNIIVETADGQKSSLFDVFKNIYSKTLETVDPSIIPLNRKYAQLSNLTDDIENSIFKTPDFQVVKSVDPAEFAKVNLRRIFGESQSSPVFEGVADAMDAASRGLGYKGATPKVVAEFAQEMRKLYPDIVPKTGFTGGIKMGIGDILTEASKIGTPQLKDQQAALKKLIEILVNQK